MLTTIKTYTKDNYVIYFVLCTILIIGLISGVIASKALSIEKIQILSQYIQTSLFHIEQMPNSIPAIKSAIISNGSLIFKIWFLGLIIIGAPLVFFIIFTRGFSLGFTVAFFLTNKGWEGLGVIFTSIFIPNLIYLPITLLSAALSISFSMYILKKSTYSLFQAFLKYSFTMSILATLYCFAGVIEGIFTSYGARIIL